MNTIFQMSLNIQLLTLSIEWINNWINLGMVVMLCHKLETAHFLHYVNRRGERVLRPGIGENWVL